MRSPLRKALLSLVLASVWSHAAHAQNNGALAENLFREGKKLLAERRFDEACPKFRESARLDLSSGVELALGICLEGQGTLASAWGAYLSAATLAHHDGRSDREEAARGRAGALEPKLSHATLAVALGTAGLKGLVVRQDDVVIESPAWANAPVDVGVHRVDVTAPGKKPYSGTYMVPSNGVSLTVPVPVLEDEPPPPAVLAPPPVDTSGTWRKPAGFVTGGVGAAMLGVGVVLGAAALSDAATVHHACPSSTCASPSIRSENQTAGSIADASTALFIAGGVVLATGAVLVLTSPRRREARTTGATWVRPVLAPSFAGVVGQW